MYNVYAYKWSYILQVETKKELDWLEQIEKILLFGARLTLLTLAVRVVCYGQNEMVL